ncbi:MAG: hypothetical protein LBR15_01300 [Methanobrevibacter sp.]|jgi:hypothetical protein|nr:hypothetical protein [Candidatus Methanovirga australis]
MKKINVVLLKILFVLFGCVSVYSIDSDVSVVGVQSVVMDNSSSIQSKLNELLDSDKNNVLLILKEGVYMENNISIKAKGKNITVKGEGNVVIDGCGPSVYVPVWPKGNGSAINENTILQLSGGNYVIEGITFKNGAGSTKTRDYGAINARYGNYSIINCDFVNNKGLTGAIAMDYSNCSITHCSFKNNHGYTMTVNDPPTDIFSEGGAIWNYYSCMNVHKCNFELNHADKYRYRSENKPRDGMFGDDIVNEYGFVNASNNFFYGGVSSRTFAGDLGSDYLVYWPVASEPFM